MNREDAKVVRSQAPNSESATKGCDAGIGAFEHTVGAQGVLLLARGLLLNVGDAGGDVRFVDGAALTLAVLDLLLELFALVLQPLRDLLAAERQLACAIRKVEDGKGVL